MVLGHLIIESFCSNVGRKGMKVGNIKMEYASLWVQIFGAPFDMISPQVAKEVGNRMGLVEKEEWK